MYKIILIQVVILLWSFGDPEYPQIYEPEQFKAYCNNSQNVVSGRDVKAAMFRLYGQSDHAVKFIKTGYSVSIYNLTCERMAAGKLDDWLKYYREVHDMNYAMKPHRDGFTRAMIAAAKNDSKLTFDDIICFVDKWVDLTEKTVREEISRRIIRAHFAAFSFYTFLYSFARGLTCDWSNIPSPPSGQHLKAPMTLLSKALARLDKPKANA